MHGRGNATVELGASTIEDVLAQQIGLVDRTVARDNIRVANHVVRYLCDRCFIFAHHQEGLVLQRVIVGRLPKERVLIVGELTARSIGLGLCLSSSFHLGKELHSDSLLF